MIRRDRHFSQHLPSYDQGGGDLDKTFLRQGFDQAILKLTENGPKTILLESFYALPALAYCILLYLSKGAISLSDIFECLIHELGTNTHLSQALFLCCGKWDTHVLTSSVSSHHCFTITGKNQ
jgi:hypothetical protein